MAALGPQRWQKKFEEAVELDSWGQVEEAREAYESIALLLQQELGNAQKNARTQKQIVTLKNLMVSLRLRSFAIRRGDETISTENMKALKTVFETLFIKDKKFPLDLSEVDEAELKRALGMELEDEENEAELIESLPVGAPAISAPRVRGAASRPGEALKESEEDNSAGQTAKINGSTKKTRPVNITIVKIGLKDFEKYQEPYVTCFLTSGGRVLEPKQDTPASTSRFDKHINFGHTITLKQGLESILPGAAIVFEFKHFKPKKDKISTKCWAFLEKVDIKEGVHNLELYKKPTDLKCKRLSLLTVKPLYLQIEIEIGEPK